MFLGIFRQIFKEDILLEQEDVPIVCGEHQSLVTGNLQDINFTISSGFPKTLLRLVGYYYLLKCLWVKSLFNDGHNLRTERVNARTYLVSSMAGTTAPGL